MFKANLLFIFLLQLNSYGFCQPNSSFLSVPESAIVKIRANVSLECVVNSRNAVFWEFINNSTGNRIYSERKIAEQMKSQYRINNEGSGQHVLVIDSVDHKHAGRYICQEFPSNEKATAELTVIDSDPMCGMNVTNMAKDQTIWLWCEINSTGFLIPHMKWTKGNGALINNTTQNTATDRLTTTTSFVRLQLHPQDNNAIERTTIKCTTSFMWKNGTTVPYYEHVWNHNLPLTTEKDATSETVSASYTQKAYATADPSPPRLEAWIIPVVGGSIVIIILIILYIVFQCRKKSSKSSNAKESANSPVQDGAAIYAEVKKKTKKKEAKGSTSSTTLPLNAGSSDKTENTKRETEEKRRPKTQRKEVEHGTENAEAYETFANRPTTSMQSETYCGLNLLKQDKPKSKPLPSAVFQTERQEHQTVDDRYQTIDDEYQTIDDYETLANRPPPTVQSETYCELQIMKKKKDKKK